MNLPHINKYFRTLLLAAAACCLSPSAAFAETDEEIEEKADEIRLDETYTYGEVSFVPSDNIDEDILTQQALSDVTAVVNEQRAAQGKSTLNPQQLYPIVDALSYTVRGRKCIFLYITLEKALAFQPSAIDNVDAGRFSAGSAPAGGSAPVAPADAVDASGAPVAPGSPAPEDSADAPAAEGDAPAAAPRPVGSPQVLEIVDAILANDAWTLTRLGQHLWTLQEEGKITEFGQANSPEDVPANAFFGRFDQTLRLKGFYGPFPDGRRLELRSLEEPADADFDGCNIVWFF